MEKSQQNTLTDLPNNTCARLLTSSSNPLNTLDWVISGVQHKYIDKIDNEHRLFIGPGQSINLIYIVVKKR